MVKLYYFNDLQNTGEIKNRPSNTNIRIWYTFWQIIMYLLLKGLYLTLKCGPDDVKTRVPFTRISFEIQTKRRLSAHHNMRVFGAAKYNQLSTVGSVAI